LSLFSIQIAALHLWPIESGYDAGLATRTMNALTWHTFDVLVKGADGLWRWPDKPWLPLAFSLRATRR